MKETQDIAMIAKKTGLDEEKSQTEQVFKMKDEVSNLAAKLKEMEKKHADIKEKLSDLKRNVDRKTLD